MTEVVVSPRNGSPRIGVAAQLLAFLEVGEVDGALKISAGLAEEMPFAEVVEGWCVGQIRLGASEALAEDAQGVWNAKKAVADPALREVAAEAMRLWAGDRVALAGKEALAELGTRLAAAKPDLAQAKGKLADLGARLAAFAPKIEEPEGWQLRELKGPIVLTKAAPMDNARSFAKDLLWQWAGQKGVLATRYWRGNWWQWNGSYYELAPRQRVSDQVYFYLDRAQIGTGNDAVRFKPKPEDATKLMSCLEPCVGLDDRSIPPRWFDDRASPNAMQLVAFRNYLVDAVTGKTFSPTPELWLHEGVDFDYDPNARCPRWDEFLCEMFPDDPDAPMTIEEHLGLGMTRDGQFEKAAMWIGKTRSGRGTLCRIQELLVGPSGHVPLNIHTWNKGENSKQGMVGKRVGIFHDVRLKEAKAYGHVSFDPGGVEYQSLQSLLEIIAGDAQAWGRKYIDAWQGVPYIKIIYVSNVPPNVNDDTLLGRFILLDFQISFADRVDPKLKQEILPAELPGIANRCLAGYRRLLERGRFVQPKSGLALIQRIREEGNCYLKFMNACYVPDPTGPGVLAEAFRQEFMLWCLDNGRPDKIKNTSSTIAAEVARLPEWQHFKSFQRRADGQKRRYPIKLRRGG